LDGKSVNGIEVCSAFMNLRVQRIWEPSDTERALFNLSEGVFVHFETHDEFKNALKVTEHFSRRTCHPIVIAEFILTSALSRKPIAIYM
jgi:hypothetical protein